MKKMLQVAAALLMTVTLTGCFNRSAELPTMDQRMAAIYNDGYAIIYVDVQTGVQYFSRVNCGTCVMVDETGMPLIYDGKR